MTGRTATALGCVLAVWIASAAEAEVLKFDFGRPQSRTRPGFTKVTKEDGFTVQKGYGFATTGGLTAFDRGGVEKKDSKYGPQRLTTDITSDLIEGPNDNAFSVTVPDGEYVVWVIVGDANWAPPIFDIWANGEKKLEVRVPRRAFVAMEPIRVRAVRETLRIEMKGEHGWLLNGLVIGRDGEELAAVAADIERDVFFVLGGELDNWKEIEHVSENPPLVLSTEEKRKGYAVFVRDYMLPVYPRAIPRRSEINAPLVAFATPGEFEPASFCIYPERDLGQVDLQISDFTDGNGHRIGRDNVEVGIVRCWPQRTGRGSQGTKGQYRIIPERIDPPRPRTENVKAGRVKQWWLTVHVPEDTAAGRYRMQLTVRPGAAPPTRLEWRLLVLPFRLTRPRDRHWGTWLDGFPPLGGLRGPERRGRHTPAEIDRIARAEMQDYRDHGFDAVLLNFYAGAKERPDGTFAYDISRLAKQMTYFKLLGSDAPVVACFEYTCRGLENRLAEKDGTHVQGTFTPKAREAVLGLVRHIRDEARKHGWPKIYFFPIDEPGNNKTKNRYLFAENVLDFVHQVPGCKTATTVTSRCIQRLGDRVDVRIYAYGHYIPEKVKREAKEGHPFWYYNNGMFYGHNLWASRAYTGFQFLKSGAETATAWGFAATYANPHNDFDNGHKDWNVLFPGLGRPTPTIYWEACREGVDDYRYVSTLREHIRRARGRGSATAARAAEKVLAPLADPAAEIRNPLAFHRYRWRIAREILKLSGDRRHALDFSPVVERAGRESKLGPNLIPNPSFENGPGENSLPGPPYAVSDPFSKSLDEPFGALSVSTEEAHSGKHSLKWDFSKATGKGASSGGVQWLVVNVRIPQDAANRIRGKRIEVGLWVRIGRGLLSPGMRFRQFGGGKFLGDAAAYKGGVEDAAVWNRFGATGRMRKDYDGLDIHVTCKVPTVAEVARESFFYVDDVYLRAFEDPPVQVATTLDEYYLGEEMLWTVTASGTKGKLSVALRQGGRTFLERPLALGAGPQSGMFPTQGLKPGVYRLEARLAAADGAADATDWLDVLLAPNPFDW